MGFFGSVMNFASKAVGFVGKAASFVQKGLDFVQKPLSSLISKPVMGFVGKLLDKLPFGIGNFVKPFAEKFLGNALNYLLPGGMSILGAVTKLAPGLSGLSDVVKKIGDVVGGIQNITQPQARSNIVETVAYAQAQKLLAA